MKKTLLLTALAVSASAALAKDPSFADFKPLDVVDGYQTYGTPAKIYRKPLFSWMAARARAKLHLSIC